MKKKDLLIIIILFALWISWPMIDRHVIKKYFFPAGPVPEETASDMSMADSEIVEAPAAVEEELKAVAEPLAEPIAEAATAPAEETAVEPVPAEPEETAVLANDRVRVTISSYGASVKTAELMEYRETIEKDSPPVVLDFSTAPALVYKGVDGLSAGYAFAMSADPATGTAAFERKTSSGLVLRRQMTLSDHYLLTVTDTLVNESSEAVQIGQHQLQTGAMENLDGQPARRGMVYLGVDTLALGGEGVKYWGKKIPGWFKDVMEEERLPKLPRSITWPLEKPVDWAAVKNKYFAQILTPEGGADECIVYARREILPEELTDPAFKPKTQLEYAWASVVLPAYVLEPGGEFTRNIQYYIGPKKYSELNRYGMHQVDIMEFGMWAPIGKLLLKIMTWIHDHIWPHNYGLAIILLTIIVRIVFWPITHKSTESMKRMQEVQPLVNELRAKYKDNPQKQQQEIMALYKEHKVNPLGGCLPMLIQIPVFIALFVVLRSAIELRFAPFLWIKDLSQPENLLAGVLPIPLNILPLVMAGTMVWQQRLTPSAGDPNQRKMMMFMPVMMLVLFYKFAAGLVLYWTTNQCLMIIQQLIMHRKKAKA